MKRTAAFLLALCLMPWMVAMGEAQSALVEPALTTVQIPSIEIGRMSADILLARIRNPKIPFSWTHIRTNPVWRKSTREV